MSRKCHPPARLELSGFLRRDDRLSEVPSMNGHVSPRLGVKFEMGNEGLRIIRRDVPERAAVQPVLS